MAVANKTVVITGVSTGIGYVAAERFIREGWAVFGSVRKPADAERVQQQLGERFTPLLFDVTDSAAINAAAAQVGHAIGNEKLGGLVNNAGYVVGGPMLHLSEAEMQQQYDVNVLGPFRCSKAFAPLLGADRGRIGKPGRIVQISSVAGSMGFPFMGAYCGSKHALNGMSESLRRELLPYGIDVIVVAPGAIETPLWDKNNEVQYENYLSTEYGPMLRRFFGYMNSNARGHALPASAVADDIWQAVTAARPRLRYEPIPRKLLEFTLPQMMPKRMVDRMFAKMLGGLGQG